MHSYEEIQELKDRTICTDCIGESFLSSAVGTVEADCHYCGNSAPCTTIGELSGHVSRAFEAHFVRTTNEPDGLQWMMMKDDELDYEFEREGETSAEAIEMAAEIPTEAAVDVQKVLEDEFYDRSAVEIGEETEFDSEARYNRRGTSDAAWQEEWRAFERSLKTEARFFSQAAAEHLRSVFSGIEQFTASDGRPLVVDAGPGFPLQFLYRARAFQSEPKLLEAIERPDLHIGSPPAGTASHGRMNARGISVFYGANSEKAAIAEVRPPVGSDVVVARFDLIRKIRLLDLTALGKIQVNGSIFDPDYAEALERGMVLRFLSRRITKPVMPDDEAMDYLATQAIADFLATDEGTHLDGIIFPSAQVKSPKIVNVVLFQKAARVKHLDLPDGSKVYASAGYDTEEGWEPQYTVNEAVPPEEKSARRKSYTEGLPGLLDSDWWSLRDVDVDQREPTLAVKTDEIVVHHIEGVQFRTSTETVTRHRHVDERLAKKQSEQNDFDF